MSLLKTFFFINLLCFSVVAFGAGELYYVFKDKRGNTIIQDYVPAEYADLGYRVINEQGLTIRVVKSAKELERIERAKQQRKLAELDRSEQVQTDDMLINSFSNAEEIREAGNNKILVIQGQIEITRNHIKAFEKNLDKLAEQDIENRRMGLDPKDNREAIEAIKSSIKKNQAFVKRQRALQNEIREEYIAYIKRFQQLSKRH